MAAKTANVTLRLDPQTRYRLDLLARKQRRSQSATMEGLIEQEARRELVVEGEDQHGEVFERDLFPQLWSPNEIERFVRLALNCEGWLSYDEAACWAVIDGTPALWVSAEEGPPAGIYDKDGNPISDNDHYFFHFPNTVKMVAGAKLRVTPDGIKISVPDTVKIEELWGEIKKAAAGDPKPLAAALQDKEKS